LVAPVTQLDSSVFIQLTVASLAAVLIAGFRSMSIAYIAAMGLGLASATLVGLGPSQGVLATGIPPALPFIVMFATLIIRKSPLITGELSRISTRKFRVELRSFRSGLLWSGPGILLLILAPFVLSSYWTGVFSEGLIYGFVFLSFTICLGEAGLISLGQAALIGIGGFSAGWIADSAHVPLLLALVIGGLVAAAVGAVLAIVTARYGTLEFAIATLAFGLFADYVIFDWQTFVPLSGRAFAKLSLDGHVLTVRQIYYFYGLVLGMGLLIFWLFRRTVGAFFVNATRMRPRVAEAIGINQVATRTLAFTFAAFMSGVGGALIGTFQLNLAGGELTTYTGLVLVAVIVTNGVRSPAAAVVAGLFYTVMPALLAIWLPIRFGVLPEVLFGLGGLALASDPRGVVTVWEESLLRGVTWCTRAVAGS
jgi:branched-chain amino acid transport system permease protein